MNLFYVFREVVCALTTFPEGTYHFISCRNCNTIISTGGGN